MDVLSARKPTTAHVISYIQIRIPKHQKFGGRGMSVDDCVMK